MIAAATTPSGADRPRLNWGHLAFLAPVHLAALLAPWTFTWTNLALAAALHALLGGLGICVGYHRLLAHRSFTARRPLRYALATLGALTVQGGPSAWVANHRKHHQHSDGPDDPHNARRGFWWAHMGWIFVAVPREERLARQRRYAPDILADPYFRVLDRWYWALQIPLALGLFAAGGFGMVVWGIGVRLVATYHSTYLVNSAAHWFGYQSFRSGDRSRNNWWVALLVYGEGWHNNHHAFPWSARHGLRGWELDVSYLAIRLFKLVGLVREIRVPSAARLRALVLPGPGEPLAST
ncbi:MAG TPA: fatty acid desaturase [Thermodesulfobacteriota bacterium]|nr:fatty acid desaturase [Thermodesulfobacteriota bacterium]